MEAGHRAETLLVANGFAFADDAPARRRRRQHAVVRHVRIATRLGPPLLLASVTLPPDGHRRLNGLHFPAVSILDPYRPYKDRTKTVTTTDAAAES